jgi:hypothetical protein
MSGKNAGTGQATVAKVKIKGVSGAKINDVDVVITLNGNVTFKYIGADDDVTDWFGNDMSAIGLDAVVTSLSADNKVITITVSGIPGNWKADALSITIPEGNNTSGSDIDVDENDEARYDIAMPITSDTEFLSFADLVNGGNRALSGDLQADIEVASTVNYTPIARDWKNGGMYSGTFNGNSHKITINLISKTGFLALFGTNSGTIHDLTVDGSVELQLDPEVEEADYIAGVVAYNDIYGTIKRVINKAAVTAATESPTQPETTHNIGGITGFNGWDQYNDDSPYYEEAPDPEEEAVGLVSQCRNEGDIIGGFNKIGGIAGENAGDIEECSNTGKITCVKGKIDKGWPGVGGIVGRDGNNNDATEKGHIINCYNPGVIADSTAEGAEQNAYGGIAGWCDSLSTVQNCYTTGDFTEATGKFRGAKNPIIGQSDDEPGDMSVNNYSLESINASSTDVPLIGIRKGCTEMKDPAFVALLNDGGAGPYVAGVTSPYPQLSWEVE